MLPVNKDNPSIMPWRGGGITTLEARKVNQNGWYINPSKTTTVSESWDFHALGNPSLVLINCWTVMQHRSTC